MGCINGAILQCLVDFEAIARWFGSVKCVMLAVSLESQHMIVGVTHFDPEILAHAQPSRIDLEICCAAVLSRRGRSIYRSCGTSRGCFFNGNGAGLGLVRDVL